MSQNYVVSCIHHIYRFIQISGMTLGGMIEADRRIRSYELRVRREKRRKADEEVWRHWGGLVEEEERRKNDAKGKEDKKTQ